MKCESCGAVLSAGSKFCSHCGNPVSDPNEFTVHYDESKRSENIHRVIDEADLKRASTEGGNVRLRIVARIIGAVVWGAVMCMLIFYIGHNLDGNDILFFILAVILAIGGMKTFSKWLR